MITCTRRIEFDAAHRIINHESKCKMLHGHRYALEATFTTHESNEENTLDDLGRVIDFGVIKEVLGNWIDDNLDHNTILSIHDQNLGNQISAITKQTIYYMQENPTAENIAQHIFNDICPLLFEGKDVKCVKIKLYETPNCYTNVE